MNICSQCHHQNSNTARQCEACGSKLSAQLSCPSCGQDYLETARFCGHCGHLLEYHDVPHFDIGSTSLADVPALNIPELRPPEPEIDIYSPTSLALKTSTRSLVMDDSKTVVAPGRQVFSATDSSDKPPRAALIHRATRFRIQLYQSQSPIHLGKPNRKVMPDINLADFKHSEVVSRIHADICIKDNDFFIRDSGSVNGTFVNNRLIRPGQAQLLKSGDKIALGKGDLVTFIFELS